MILPGEAHPLSGASHIPVTQPLDAAMLADARFSTNYFIGVVTRITSLNGRSVVCVDCGDPEFRTVTAKRTDRFQDGDLVLLRESFEKFEFVRDMEAIHGPVLNNGVILTLTEPVHTYLAGDEGASRLSEIAKLFPITFLICENNRMFISSPRAEFIGSVVHLIRDMMPSCDQIEWLSALTEFENSLSPQS